MYFYIPGASLLLKQTISSKRMKIEEKGVAKGLKTAKLYQYFLVKIFHRLALSKLLDYLKRNRIFHQCIKLRKLIIQIMNFTIFFSRSLFHWHIKSTKKHWCSLNFLPSSTTSTCQWPPTDLRHLARVDHLHDD